MALGHELGADDDVDLAVLDLAQGLAEIADAWREIARQQHAPRLGKEGCNLLVDAFDAGPARHERMLSRAIGAGLGDRHEGPAMVSFEPAAEAVLDQPGRAVGAFEFEAAIPADGDRGIAAPVQEQESLLSAFQGFAYGFHQHRRQPLAALWWARAH